jgi:hypothetical protein
METSAFNVILVDTWTHRVKAMGVFLIGNTTKGSCMMKSQNRDEYLDKTLASQLRHQLLKMYPPKSSYPIVQASFKLLSLLDI